jgi:diaminopimelate epimerase
MRINRCLLIAAIALSEEQTQALGGRAFGQIISDFGKRGYADKDTDIRVRLFGGKLAVRYADDAVFMTGECKKVFDGSGNINVRHCLLR